MSGIRAHAKRKLMANRNHIYLVGGIGRVRRGSIVHLGVRLRGQYVAFGWIKADQSDPKVHWGTRRP